MLSTYLLSEGPGGALQGIALVGWISLTLALIVPVGLMFLERRVKGIESARRAVGAT
jgi:hypothetical protein